MCVGIVAVLCVSKCVVILRNGCRRLTAGICRYAGERLRAHTIWHRVFGIVT